MTEPSLELQMDAAQAYEAVFIPALFGRWAPQLAQQARLQPGDRVLDVACGTGMFAREAIARVTPDGTVTGIDPSPAMLAVAAQRWPTVAWTLGTAEQLPYPDERFDVVACAFGLMFFSDRNRGLEQMHRVLAPGGRLVLAVWSQLERSPGYAMMVAMLERLAGREAADALRRPFELGDPEALRALLADAGFGNPTIVERPGRATFPSISALVQAEVRGWLPACGVMLDELTIDRLQADAERALAPYRADGGTVDFECPAVTISATKSRPPIRAR